MNFDIINKISDESISKLYDDMIIDGIEDGVQVGCCECGPYSASWFGCYPKGDCSYILNIKNSNQCSDFCSGRGKFYSFYIYCYCKRYSEHEGTYGDVNRCPY